MADEPFTDDDVAKAIISACDAELAVNRILAPLGTHLRHYDKRHKYDAIDAYKTEAYLERRKVTEWANRAVDDVKAALVASEAEVERLRELLPIFREVEGAFMSGCSDDEIQELIDEGNSLAGIVQRIRRARAALTGEKP